LDELEKLLAEELDEFLEEEREDLPSTPPSEKDSIFWGCGASDVGSDEGDGENERTPKLGDEQGEASETLDIPLRGRTVPPKSTTAPKSTSTLETTTAPTQSFLQDTVLSTAEKHTALKDTANNTQA
jgi:hypothetical protein